MSVSIDYDKANARTQSPTAIAASFAAISSVARIDTFGGRPGLDFDNTAAFAAAVSALGSAGGIVEFPTAGEWRGNFLVSNPNIQVRGRGGRGEEGIACLRPWSTGANTYTLRFDGGSTNMRKVGIVDLVISGDDGSGNQAAEALSLRSGVVHFWGTRFELIDGVHSLHIEPGVSYPVTCTYFSQFQIRNDYSSASARSIYIKRNAGSGYTTANSWLGGHVNKTGSGYAVEIDGGAYGLRPSFTDVYMDIPDGGGVLINGGATGMDAHNLYLDAGASGAVVIETDQSTTDPARVIAGLIHHGGGKFKNGSGTLFTMPAESDTFSYKARHHTPFLSELIYLTTNADPYNTSYYFDFGTSTGPLRLNGLAMRFRDTTQATSLTAASLVTDGGAAIAKAIRVGGDFYVYGGNATAGASLTANSAGGGGYFEAIGTNQNFRFMPSGSGYSMHGGTGTIPTGDDTQILGGAGNRWSTVYAGTGSINTSDARTKQDVRTLDQQEAAVARRIKSLLKAYRFKDAVAAKGDQARVHFGVIAQDVMAAFAAEGLDATRYALLCHDEIPAFEGEPERPALVDDDGTVLRAAIPAKPPRPSYDQFGIRYDELYAFMIAAL